MNFRLVNMICKQKSTESIWKIIKKVKKNFVSGTIAAECLNPERNDILVSDDNIKTILDNVEKILKVEKIFQNYEYLPQENITNDTLLTGAEMYTYLSFCPPMKLMNFYSKLFQNGSTKDIILGITNIMKTRINAEKSSAIQLWEKVAEKLKPLKYKQIKSVSMKNMKSPEEIGKSENVTISADFRFLGLKKFRQIN